MARSSQLLVPLGLTQLFSLISSFTVDRAFLRASGSTGRAGGNWGGLGKPVRERGRLNKEGRLSFQQENLSLAILCQAGGTCAPTLCNPLADVLPGECEIMSSGLR